MTRPESSVDAAAARPAIRLRVLGAVELCDEQGSPVRSILAQPRRLALLAYLAMSSHRGFVRRDQAIALFWPEHDSEHARAALNRAVYFLRQSIGDHTIVSRGGDELAVSADHLWCDAVALQTAMDEARYADAVAVCRGELLEGFFVSNAPGFERWVDDERRRHRSDVTRAAWSLADGAERDGNYAEAAQWFSWAVDRSPLDETGVRRLMAMLDRAGDRAGAVLAYDRFARRLASDLELSPAPETRMLLDAIRLRDT
ncbi:MAG TPA: BTAD domain-containing putative transcriptional regulator, partial [Gemmatimonadaceae bacterium]|nr:BTAD domain-containing putative transcriptional regulator [Gemmatimonadaceae bacterium]